MLEWDDDTENIEQRYVNRAFESRYINKINKTEWNTYIYCIFRKYIIIHLTGWIIEYYNRILDR